MELHPKPAIESKELGAAALKAVRDELWRRGVLSWKCHTDQFAVYEQIKASTASRYVLEIARRWGKTHLLVLIAIETCLQRPGARVVYGAPTLKHLQEFILPTFEKIIADAPKDCRPVWHASSGHWKFPNGALVHLFGADDKRKADRGRGPAADLCIFDEAGFCPILKYVLSSVFRHQLLHSRGRTLLGSTPAEEPEHDFTIIAERAEANGNYTRRTLWDNPLLTDEQREAFIADDAKEEGLSIEAYMQTDTFRRECLAERVTDRLLVVVPEWAEVRTECLVPIERPEYFHASTILDFGGNDPHAVNFAYWHFKAAKWVIEDELTLRNGENSAVLSEAIKGKERALWGTDKWAGTMRGLRDAPTQAALDALPDWMADILNKEETQEQPFMRWSDNQIQLVRDLYELHGLAFIPTAKDEKELQVNNLRVMMRAKQVLIHPRCVATDRHLRQTTWANHRRRDYARRAGEHGDHVDTLVYGARNLDKRNPIPAHLLPRVRPRGMAAHADNVLSGGALGRLIANRKTR